MKRTRAIKGVVQLNWIEPILTIFPLKMVIRMNYKSTHSKSTTKQTIRECHHFLILRPRVSALPQMEMNSVCYRIRTLWIKLTPLVQGKDMMFVVIK